MIPVIVKESFADHGREGVLVRQGLRLVAHIRCGVITDLIEVCVQDQFSAVDCVGSGNVEGVTVGGNPKNDLLPWEASFSPSLDGPSRGARPNR